jgi:hypothetical protein
VSFSWFDPHFEALFVRRQEERLAEKLAARLRERIACDSSPHALRQRGSAATDDDVVASDGHLRLL